MMISINKRDVEKFYRKARIAYLEHRPTQPNRTTITININLLKIF